MNTWIISRFPRILLRLMGGTIGTGSKIGTLESWSRIGKVRIGDCVYIGPKARIFARAGVVIGDGTIIGPRLTIYSSNHNFKSEQYIPYDNNRINDKPVQIGRGCWIGDSCIILPGTVIEDHCLIGAGAVVRGKIGEGSIAFGNPAVVQSRLPSSLLEKKRELLRENRFYL